MVILTPQFNQSPWILALFPPILTVRGGIGGIFSGNLATMLHLGFVKPQLRNNTESYRELVKSVLVITVIDTLVLGSFSFIVNIINGSTSIYQWFLFLCVPTVACTLAVCVSIPITSYIAIETFNRGLDPDILVYPILASVNDIVVTSFFVGVVFLVLKGGFLYSSLIGMFFIILSGAGYIFVTLRGNRYFQQTISEGTFVVIISSIFGSLNGVLLSNLRASLVSNPGLMTLYPAITNSLGSIGSIIGSKTTTDIALGYSKSFSEELKKSGQLIILVEIPGVIMSMVFAFISFMISKSQGAVLSFLVSTALFCNFMSFAVISVFALWSAHIAFQRGLNPDNIVIPAITSLSDTTATIALKPALLVARILGL
jgi:mgtE-like transporter